MTNMKATKRALGSSVLALFLCFAMLLGTTFAWFTDSVTSNNNIITAGNLDVEFKYAKVENGTLTAWDTVSGKDNIFDKNALWEPGRVEVVYLEVSNLGSLALKYQLGINVVGKTIGKTYDGKDIDLADHLVFKVVELDEKPTAAYTNEEALNVAGTEKGLSGYNSETTALEVGGVDYVAVIIYMPETVGNEANYRGDVAPTITLGLNVFATQYNKEADSFGDDYDADAIFYDKLVTTDAELKAAIEATDVKVIAIDGDLTYNWGVDSYENSKALLMKGKVLRGYDDNAYITFAGYGSANPITDVTLMDITVKDATVGDNENSWEHGHLEFVSLKATNVTFANSIMLDGDSTLTDCSMDNIVESWYGLWIEGGNTVIENCYFTGYRAIKIHEAYGSEVESVVIDNCAFVELSEKPGVVIGDVDANTNIAITNNEFIGIYSYETDTDVKTFKFTHKNNIVPVKVNEGLYKDQNSVYYATTTDGLNAGISDTSDSDTIVLSKDIEYTGSGYANITKNITLDLNGHNLSTTSFGVIAKAGTIKNGTITNPVGGRAALRTWSGVSIENVTVVSPKNGGITVAEGNSLPSIKNVTINAKTYGIELQNYASVGTIENVTIVAGENGIVVKGGTINKIENCTINGEKCGVWAQLKGTNDLNLNFVNCAISGGKYGIYMCDEGATPVPGVAKLSYDEETTFEGGVKDKEFVFGQLENGKLVINNKTVAMFISTAEELFAFANKVNVDKNTFSGKTVLLTADINLENKAWTPIGQTGATQFMGTFDGNGYTIKNLNIDSSAQEGKHYSSGLFGWLNNATVKNVTIENATVTGNHNVAVIAGYMETSGCTISNCHVIGATVVANHANGDACGDKVGVIVGHAGNAGVKVENCTAKNCKVKAGRDAGQIAGAALTANVTGCTATDVTVTAGGNCTGDNINNAIIGRVLG